MQQDIRSLVDAAGLAAQRGAMAEAERLWRDVRRADPNHPGALMSLSVHALQRGDAREACDLLTLARRAAPGDPMLAATHAVALRRLGDANGEWQALQDALALDPYFLPAHLEKAAFLERSGRPRGAAAALKNALTIAGDDESLWPEALHQRLAQARVTVARYSDELAGHLSAAIGPLGGALSRAEHERWAEATSIMAGQSRPYASNSNQLFVPRLPAIPFFDSDAFAWAPALEARTAEIRQELETVLADEAADFTPYITYRAGEPINQWAELNHSQRWSTYPLWKGGLPQAENLARCPKTTEALKAVEMAEIGGLCPNAMFSALAPHTEIPPHHGETNARLVVHLPLIVPEHCTYRVGFERRQWEVGKVLIFDDTLEHTARNDSDEVRVVLIFDVWNPLLSESERALVNAMTSASRAFHAEP